MSDGDGSIPGLGDVMDYPETTDQGERRWVVLYPEDYDNFVVDPNGNLAVLVGQQQAGEILALTAEVVASLSHRDATGDDVLRDMRDALDEEIGETDE